MADGSPGEGSKRRLKPLALSVTVASLDQGYPVLVGSGLLGRLGKEIKRSHPKASRVALVSDTNVSGLYGADLEAVIEAEGYEVHHFTVEPGEASKSPAGLLDLVEQFVAAGLSRQDLVVALGGGVVGDLAGLAAALFMRGIDLIQCPTSLLAQVDSSVGGKVAVDLPSGKNLLGAFHFPAFVLIDTAVLETLPDRALACGLAEMLKHGALFSRDHFAKIIGSADAIYSREPEVLAPLVASSVALKAACVSRDPLERGDAGKGRVLLNLGHTVGHGLESLSGYELMHGEAVGLGLRAAARISERKGIAAPGLEATIVDALEAVRLPSDLDSHIDTEDKRQALIAAMSSDKKRTATTITYIVLKGLGEPATLPLDPAEIVALLHAQPADC